MRLTRRHALAGALGAVAAARLPGRAEDMPTLTARPGIARLVAASGPPTAIWGYEAGVPGPEFRVPQGARFARRFVNELTEPSTVHWHGVRVPNAMDGVPGLTQQAVEPGADFVYDFTPPDAGTYWYHAHNRTWEQLARGLYGALIVEEPEPPEVDADTVLILDDWRLTESATIDEGFGSIHDRAHAGRIGNWITVNGQPEWRRKAGQNSRFRLRLINAANARIFSLLGQGLSGHVVALDGMPLEQPMPFERLTLAPAQRADLIVDLVTEIGSEAFLLSEERTGTFVLAGFRVTEPVRWAPLPAPEALPPNPVPPPGALPEKPTAILRMEGGAMGQLARARMDGRLMEMRELAGRGMAWAMNRTVGMPEDPLIDAARGETVRLMFRNDTAWPHAMHLHGHHFRRVRDGAASGPLRDTLLVERGEAAEVAFVASEPGNWLLHCHMVDHAAAGMTTWIRVQ